MIVVVLGMHKSGTTLVAKALHQGGVRMLGGAPGGAYPREKYEWGEFKAVKHRLLGSRPEDSLGIALGEPLRQSAELDLEARALIARVGAQPGSWGFKDPRTTLTYGYWKVRLPAHLIVAIERDPREVALHY